MTGTHANTFSFFAVDENGVRITDAGRITVDFGSGSQYFEIVSIDPLTGKIIVRLTADGLAALADGILSDDLLTVSVDGKDYTMPLVINNGQDYDYVAEENRADLGTELKAEWYALDRTGAGNPVLLDTADVILGGAAYNQVDVHNAGSGWKAGAANSSVDISAGDTGLVDISASSTDSNAYALYTAKGGSSSIKAGEQGEVRLHASAEGTSTGNAAYALYSTGAVRTTIDAGTIDISAERPNGVGKEGNWGNVSAGGVVAYDGAKVNLTGNDISITAEIAGNNGNASGVFSGKAGTSVTISGRDGQANEMTFTGKSGQVGIGLLATNNGQITVNGGDRDDRITVNGESTNGYMGIGIFSQAENTSKATLHGGEGNDTLIVNASMSGTAQIQSGDSYDVTNGGSGAYGIVTAWGSAKTEIDGFENVEINATSTGAGGSAYGMFAHAAWGLDAVTTIKNDSAMNLTINASALDPAKAYSMYANWGGKNVIQGGSRAGDVDGDKITLNGHMYGGKGANEITTGSGNDTVILNGNMQTPQGYNQIHTGLGDDVVHVTGAVSASGGGRNEIKTGDGNDTVILDKNLSAAGGKNIVDTGSDAGDSVSIGGGVSASGSGSSNTVVSGDVSVGLGNTATYGLSAQNGSGTGSAANSVTSSGEVNIRVNSGNAPASGNFWGLYAGVSAAGGTAVNTVTGGGDVHIAAQSGASGYVSAIEARGVGAENRVTSQHGDIIIDSAANTAHTATARNDAVTSTSGGKISLKAEEGAITITSSNQGSLALGIYAEGDWSSGKSEVHLLAKDDITINAESQTTRAHETGGIYANRNAEITLESTAGNIKINATAAQGGPAYAVMGNNMTRLTAAGDIIYAVNSGGSATGHYGGGTLTAGGDAIMDVHSTGGAALGVSAMGLSNISIDAANVDIDVSSLAGQATGMYTYDRSVAEVTADSISVSAASGGAGNAYGLRVDRPNSAYETGNFLEGDTVSVVADASGSTGNAYAMHAQGTGYSVSHNAANTISADGDAITVTIIAKSGAGQAYAMWAEGYGAVNSITGGSGNDRISLTGDIHAANHGSNTISTGDGNDVISLHGKVDSNASLSLNSGDGYDTLVLIADNYAQFEAFYGSWLKANFSGMDVEAVHINLNGLSAADQSNLHNYFNNPVFDHTSITYMESGTLHLDGYLNDMGVSVLNLDDLLGTVQGHHDLGVLDMSGTHANTLNVSISALDAMRANDGASRIMGDADDTVKLAGTDWSQSAGTSRHDGVDYYTYSNGDTEVLIQQNIVVSFGG